MLRRRDVIGYVIVARLGATERFDDNQVGLGQVDGPGAHRAATDDLLPFRASDSLVHDAVFLTLARQP